MRLAPRVVACDGFGGMSPGVGSSMSRCMCYAYIWVCFVFYGCCIVLASPGYVVLPIRGAVLSFGFSRFCGIIMWLVSV